MLKAHLVLEEASNMVSNKTMFAVCPGLNGAVCAQKDTLEHLVIKQNPKLSRVMDSSCVAS